MDAFVYVDPVNSNLICCICRNPFVDPTTASPCGHTFCRACIDQALDVAQCCPIDRGQLSSADLHPAPSLVRNMVDELLVQCPNAPLGCTHTSQRHLISSHYCTYTPVPCSAPSCSQTVLKHHANAHKDDEQDDCPYKLVLCPTCNQLAPSSDPEQVDPSHPPRCPARPTTCPHCDTTTPHNQLAEHTQSCSAVPTPCPLASFGCTYTGPADTLPAHQSTCAFEPLKPFLALTQSRMTALERTVTELKRELDATKKSLGPWFKSASGQQTNEPEPPRFEFRPLVSRRRVSSPLHTSMFHFDDSDSGPNGQANGNRRRAGSGSSSLRVSSSAEGDAPAELSLDPFSHILPPSPTSAESQQQRETIPYIPPLNTNASLEHTLSTLRNSLVSVAASLDMAERRQEMVVTTESLRMHEEVGSMRAIVHGLRMQVSALVMERNVAMMGRMNAGRTGAATTNSSSTDRANANPERNEGERWATETRYYNQHPPPPVNLAVPYSVRRQETNNKL